MRHDNYVGVEQLTLALVAMNQAVAPPILSALGASQATLRAAILEASGRPADAAKSQVARRRRTPLPHECPSTQIMLICACKAISPSRRLRIQIGGSVCITSDVSLIT